MKKLLFLGLLLISEVALSQLTIPILKVNIGNQNPMPNDVSEYQYNETTGEYEYQYSFTIKYDNNNNPLVLSIYINGDTLAKTLYSYDNKGRLIEGIYNYHFDEEVNDYHGVVKQVYTYDTDGSYLDNIKYEWNSDLKEWEVNYGSYKSDLKYDESGRLLEKYYYVNKNNTWELDTKYNYYYNNNEEAFHSFDAYKPNNEKELNLSYRIQYEWYNFLKKEPSRMVGLVYNQETDKFNQTYDRKYEYNVTDTSFSVIVLYKSENSVYAPGYKSSYISFGENDSLMINYDYINGSYKTRDSTVHFYNEKGNYDSSFVKDQWGGILQNSVIRKFEDGVIKELEIVDPDSRFTKRTKLVFHDHQNTLNSNPPAFSSGLNVYPNPATDLITVTAENIVIARIFNLQGKMVKAIEWSENQTSIDVSKLPSSVYILELENQRGVKEAVRVIVR